jgi:hypothetical protein
MSERESPEGGEGADLPATLKRRLSAPVAAAPL